MVVDPYPTYEWVRARGRLCGNASGLVTVDHALCDRILRHPAVRTFNARRYEVLDSGPAVVRWLFGRPDRTDLIDPIGPESIIGMDGPDHGRLRRIAGAAFTPAQVERLRPRLTELADELLSRATRQPSFDLMADFARVLPVTAICELLDIPAQDRDRFQHWGADVAADLDAIVPAARQRAATVALRELQDYFTDLLARRRADPGDDVLSEAIQRGSLTSREALVLASLLVLVGFETTVNLIGNGTMALLAHPDQFAQLRADRTLIPHAVEELLRFDAPVQTVARWTPEPLRVDGVDIPAEVSLSLLIGGANRDPAVFTDPDRLDVTRPEARRHLSFATGAHHCLGSPLARLEGEIAFAALTDHLARLEPAGRPVRRRTFVLRGFASIPLRSR